MLQATWASGSDGDPRCVVRNYGFVDHVELLPPLLRDHPPGRSLLVDYLELSFRAPRNLPCHMLPRFYHFAIHACFFHYFAYLLVLADD